MPAIRPVHRFALLAALVLAMAPARGGDVPAGMAIGIDALRFQDPGRLEAEFADIARLGATWIRTDLNWRLVQPADRLHFDWSLMDRILDLAAAHDLKLLPVIGGVPDWARVTPGGAGDVPFDREAFGRFVTAAVARYQPRGIAAWEIWNEPNMAGFWPPAPDPVAYARVLGVAAEAIRAIDPGALIISGGLAAAPTTGPAGRITHYAAPDFLAAVYAAGGGANFDAVGFHPYSFPLLPGDPAPWNGWSLMTGPIRALMEARGDAAKPVWITEYGAPTNRASGVSEALQAQMLTEAFTRAGALGWTGPLFWYSYRDLGTDPSDPEDWFGLMSGPDRPKPAAAAFRALSHGQPPDAAGP